MMDGVGLSGMRSQYRNNVRAERPSGCPARDSDALTGLVQTGHIALLMDKLSYHRHRYPSIVIQQAIWLYFRFALSYREVEDLLAERGIDVSYETVRRWALKFGAIIARKLRRGRPRPDVRWHLDEVFVSINGRQFYIRRAVDSEGEILDILVQSRRDHKAALKLMRKTPEEAGRHSSHHRDRQARILLLGAARTWSCAGTRYRSLEE